MSISARCWAALAVVPLAVFAATPAHGEPDAAAARPAPPAPFYSRTESESGYRGCITIREITDDHLSIDVRCADGGGYHGGRALRALEFRDVTLAPGAGLDKRMVRRSLAAARPALMNCLARAPATIELHAVVDRQGHVLARSLTGAPDPATGACLREVVAALRFPGSHGALTRIACTLRYTVEDPRALAGRMDSGR